MSTVLDMTEPELFERVNKKKEYVILKKKANQSEYEEIKEVALDNGYIFVNYEKLADELIACAQESNSSYAIRKKDEIERAAKANR